MEQTTKQFLVNTVGAIFNDHARGERPVVRRPDGLFGPASVAWQVHGDVTTMMVGGIAALLLQMLHPAVLAGVWDHSNFREDMHCRDPVLITWLHATESMSFLDACIRYASPT